MEKTTIAYFINQYPKVSHSFIRREILALERQGHRVLRFALRGWDAELVDQDDLDELHRTQHLLRGGIPGLLPALLRSLVQAPHPMAKAIALAYRRSKQSHRGLAYHLVWLAEACLLVQRLQREGPVHMHAHFGTNSAEVVMLASILSGMPYSFTIHGSEEWDQPVALGLGEKAERARFVVTVCDHARAQLCRWTRPAAWERIHVVRCGLERGFHEGVSVPLSDTRQFLCIGRLHAVKGHLLLLDAAAQLKAEGVDCSLIFAGDGEMRGELECAIREKGLAGRVHITGYASATQVREMLQASRALILPSFMESLPVVLMEALAMRRPVIATWAGGIPELVEPGADGWLVSPGSAGALAEAMKACLSTPVHSLRAMGDHGHEKVLRLHDVDRAAQRLSALFESDGASAHEEQARADRRTISCSLKPGASQTMS